VPVWFPLDLDLGKISAVAAPVRVTGPLLDVLEVFVGAFDGDADVHGWAIIKATKRSGPTVYGVLDRLEDMGWISGRWEDQHPEPSKPRRRFYRLTPTGAVGARRMLHDRRPQALRRSLPPAPGPVMPSWLRVPRLGGAR
jgi:PadR family transcriptional regulator, regulatory protein PadR